MRQMIVMPAYYVCVCSVIIYCLILWSRVNAAYAAAAVSVRGMDVGRVDILT